MGELFLDRSVSSMIAFGLLLLATAATASQGIPTLTLYGSQYQGLVPRKPISLVDVYARPVFVLAEVSGREETNTVSLYGKSYNAYYLHYGLRTVKDYHNFEPLYQYFIKSDALAGVVFFPDQHHAVFNPFFFKNFLNRVELPDNFSILEFVKGLSYPIPVLVVTPRQEFSSYDFRGFSDIGTFEFSEEQEEASEVQGAGQQPPQSSVFNPFVYPTLVVPTRPKEDVIKPPKEVPDKVVPTNV